MAFATFVSEVWALATALQKVRGSDATPVKVHIPLHVELMQDKLVQQSTMHMKLEF